MSVESLLQPSQEVEPLDRYFPTPNFAYRICHGTRTRIFQSTGFWLEIGSVDPNCCIVAKIQDGYMQTTSITYFPDKRNGFFLVENKLVSPALNEPVRTRYVMRQTHNLSNQLPVKFSDEEGAPVPENQARNYSNQLHQLRTTVDRLLTYSP